MSNEFVYALQDVRKKAGQVEVLKGITLAFLPDAKIGVIGANGAGKTTLMRIMAGVDDDFEGVATPMPGVTVGYVPQEPVLDESLDVRGNIEEGLAPVRDMLKEFDEVCERLGDDLTPDEMDKVLERQAVLQDRIDAVQGWELDRRLEIAMDAMRTPPGDADVSVLSGGEKRRVALCKLLLENPEMLLLDEPTNHLDAETIAWLQQHLIDYKGTCLIVTHDRYFLDDITGWILELDRGRGIPYEGNY